MRERRERRSAGPHTRVPTKGGRGGPSQHARSTYRQDVQGRTSLAERRFRRPVGAAAISWGSFCISRRCSRWTRATGRSWLRRLSAGCRAMQRPGRSSSSDAHERWGVFRSRGRACTRGAAIGNLVHTDDIDDDSGSEPTSAMTIPWRSCAPLSSRTSRRSPLPASSNADAGLHAISPSASRRAAGRRRAIPGERCIPPWSARAARRRIGGRASSDGPRRLRGRALLESSPIALVLLDDDLAIRPSPERAELQVAACVWRERSRPTSWKRRRSSKRSRGNRVRCVWRPGFLAEPARGDSRLSALGRDLGLDCARQ